MSKRQPCISSGKSNGSSPPLDIFLKKIITQMLHRRPTQGVARIGPEWSGVIIPERFLRKTSRKALTAMPEFRVPKSSKLKNQESNRESVNINFEIIPSSIFVSC